MSKRKYKTYTAESTQYVDEVNTSKPPAKELTYKVISKSGLRLRKGPSQKTDTIEVLDFGTIVIINHIAGEWGHTANGWVMMKYLEVA